VASQAKAQYLLQNQAPKSGVVDKLQAAEIDWGGEYYYATGEGVMPSTSEEPNRGRAYLKAKGFGKMKAIANLLMAVEGTTISYKTTGKDYIVKDDTLRQTIEGYVANVEVVSDKQQIEGGDAMVVVTVRAPMYGPDGPGSAVLRSKIKQDKPIPDPAGSVNVEKHGDGKSASVSDNAIGPFSSVIIDCSGLDVERAMSPKIRRADGSEVWGTLNVDYDFLQDHGIVAYALTADQAKNNQRAGSNPLMIKAIGRAGDRFMCDAVISDTDADRLIRENSSTHFLNKFNVIFMVGGR